MMNCERAREATVLAAYGELESGLEDELRTHLGGCAACSSQARDVRAVRELVAGAEGSPGDLAGEQLGGVLETAAGSRAVGDRRGSFVLGAAAAAVIAVGAVLLAVRGDREPVRVALASGGSGVIGASTAEAPSTPSTDDPFEGEIQSIQTDIAALESSVGEF